MNFELKEIQSKIDEFISSNPNESVGELCDSINSFKDLYRDRAALAALAFINMPYAWKSKIDDEIYKGEFLAGIPTPNGMITYKFDLEYWDLFKIPEIPYDTSYLDHLDNADSITLMKFIKDSNIRLIHKDNISSIEDVVNRKIISKFSDDPLKIAAYVSFYNR